MADRGFGMTNKVLVAYAEAILRRRGVDATPLSRCHAIKELVLHVSSAERPYNEDTQHNGQGPCVHVIWRNSQGVHRSTREEG